jgi:hypothetical protein
MYENQKYADKASIIFILFGDTKLKRKCSTIFFLGYFVVLKYLSFKSTKKMH